MNLLNKKGFSDVTSFLTYSLIGVGILVLRYVHENSDETPISLANNLNVTESSFFASSSFSNNYEQNQSINESQRLLSSNDNINDSINSSFFQNFKNKCSQKLFFRNKLNALFVIMYIYFSNITFFGLLNMLVSIKYILIGFFVLSNIISTILLSIFKQPKKNPLITFTVFYL